MDLQQQAEELADYTLRVSDMKGNSFDAFDETGPLVLDFYKNGTRKRSIIADGPALLQALLNAPKDLPAVTARKRAVVDAAREYGLMDDFDSVRQPADPNSDGLASQL